MAFRSPPGSRSRRSRATRASGATSGGSCGISRHASGPKSSRRPRTSPIACWRANRRRGRTPRPPDCVWSSWPRSAASWGRRWTIRLPSAAWPAGSCRPLPTSSSPISWPERRWSRRRWRASRRPPPNACGSVAPPDPSREHPIARVIRTGEAALMSEVPASWREHWAGSPEEQDLWEQRSILIVEDHPDACDGLRIALSLKGHHVRATMTGRDAIEEMRTHPPEIALVDIGLPDIDGDEVGRIIRSQPGGDGVYLVALTGLGAPADVDNALWAGFDSYMVKPVDPEKLTEVIAHAHR